MEDRTFQELLRLFQDKFGPGWLNDDIDQWGFVHDLRRALHDLDGAYSVRVDEENGQIVCRVEPAARFHTLSQLDAYFYQLWGQVAEQLSIVQRITENANVHYLFLTGSDTHGHSGAITFFGDAIRHFSTAYVAAREPASVLREARDQNNDQREV